ncbi:protein PIN-LIKES 1-like isoform X2 [Tasmannia lanceolata]|uniref:protein PIN-LIKES 1-like isoform X2 n=1 Tax=Tasmannia lanceolata TaxID=3420 RepID=UPI004062EFF2
MGLLDLFIAASIPVLKVLIVTGVGSFLATSRVDILGEDARKHLNNVVFYVFNPALVSTNLSRTITFESMISLWFMPLNILLTFIIGSALGWVVIQITNAPSHLRGLILGCCAAGNLGNMLLIIIPAICKEKGSPFGDPDVCHTYGMAYVSLSMALLPEVHTGSLTSDHYAAQCSPSSSKSEGLLEKVSIPVKFIQFLKMVSGKIDLKKLLAPSTIGVVVGFVVGVIPQTRRALIGETAPLRVIQDSAVLLSDGAIPSLTLIMGGNLIKGIHGSGIRVSLIIGVLVVRYIVLPLLGIVVVKGAIYLGLVHSDPLYQFILLIQFALPPAMNIGTMTQLFGAGESECSVIFLWCYALASVSLTLWSTFFMWLVS